MNGVRRFFNQATSLPPTPEPLILPPPGPSWPPREEVSEPPLPAPPLLRETPIQPTEHPKTHTPTSSRDLSTNTSSLSSIPTTSAQLPVNGSVSDGRNAFVHSPEPWQSDSDSVRPHFAPPDPVFGKDDLLLSLLASEAIVDSRDCEVLGTDDLDALKAEQQTLLSRLQAISKKLALETKMREATLSLGRLKSPRGTASKLSPEQVASADLKLTVTQREYWRVSARANEVQKTILGHRTAVLSNFLRRMESKHGSSPGRESDDLSTASSATSLSSAKRRFEGAHLYAGHEDAFVPLGPESTAKKLKSLTQSLQAEKKVQADLNRELAHMRLENSQLETTMTMDLQSAEEKISALEAQVERLVDLERQIESLQKEKEAMHLAHKETQREAEASRRHISELEQNLGDLRSKENISPAFQLEKEIWLREREVMTAELARLGESSSIQLTALQKNYEETSRQKSDEISKLQLELEMVKVEIENAKNTLWDVFRTHKVELISPQLTLQNLADSLTAHMAMMDKEVEDLRVAKNRLEMESRSSWEARDKLFQELEDSRIQRERTQSDLRQLEDKLKAQSDLILELSTPPTSKNSIVSLADPQDHSQVMASLRSLWMVLPSPESRALKLNARSPTKSKSNHFHSPSSSVAAISISDLDVRSLKSLYDPRSATSRSQTLDEFSLETFVSRVQALIADDRALIERLIRFAQSHELLKTNAERAQKLAQDSSAALETYQKQVKTLQERNITNDLRAQEIQNLQEALEEAREGRRELEMRAADQAAQIGHLQEANNALSAQALKLAAEPEAVRVRMEAQIAELRKSLKEADDERERMINSEQIQRVTLLDELNLAQTENAKLREQLRKR
ncbi:hypothetical protein SISSUDRAFT_1125231 [Sistotremastrum suecicum HHB10207 ss-3]|uniref:Up-regulated during septation protein 1 domain-containing protein n=1 Tax=Sistotremastrum suecicum HHB10207 ss-3 TaxID=1314776 RepID=A0A166HQZ7_9AGAM|nr:hypothetical protein SISSUDRAFT_1125231 [Sistotremastrum suecicum HHB10207 ss-3]